MDPITPNAAPQTPAQPQQAPVAPPAAPPQQVSQPTWPPQQPAAPVQPQQPTQQPFGQPTAPAAPAQPAFDASKFGNVGIDLSKFQSVDDVVKALADQNRQQQHALQFVASQMGGRPATPQSPATPAAPQGFDPDKHFAAAWDLPQQDPQWESMIRNGSVEKDASGAYVPTPGNEYLAVSPALAAMNNWEFQYRQKAQGFLQNPIRQTYDAMKPVLENTIKSEVERGVRQYLEQQQAEQTKWQLLAQHDAQLFAGTVTDPYTGEQTRQLSPWGQQVQAAVDELDRRSNGSMSAADLLQVAIRFVPPPQAQAPPVAQPQAQPPAQPPAPQSFVDHAFDLAAYRPNGTGAMAPGQHAGSPTSRKTMFIDAARQLAGGVN